MNISFFLTERQIRERTKWVTRRLGWKKLKPGAVLKAIVKGQGLKKGESIVQLCTIRVVSFAREPLSRLIDDPIYGAAEAVLEGFPGWTGQQFVDFLCKENPSCTPDTVVNRIQFEYVD